MRAIAPEKGPQSATGQLFWSTVEFPTREKSSAKCGAPPDGERHEFALDLRANPNWAGMTDRLRFDPIVASGVSIEIRLQP